MAELAEWLRGLVALIIWAGFLELILPAHELQRFLRLILGLVLVVAMLKPLSFLFHSSPSAFSLPTATSAASEGESVARLRERGEAVRAAGMAAAIAKMAQEREREIRALAEPLGLKVQGVELAPAAGGQVRLRIRLGERQKAASVVARSGSAAEGGVLVPRVEVPPVARIRVGEVEDGGKTSSKAPPRPAAGQAGERLQQKVAAFYNLPPAWVSVEREGEVTGDDGK